MTRRKRVLDVVCAGAGIVLLSPLLGLIAVAVKVCDGGPVLFHQHRVGRGGRLFVMWKFRSMRIDAERVGPPLSFGGDPRVTRVGRWLRASRLDELPQLFNVLRGDMSMVGPRPELPRYVALYTPEQRRVLDLQPGITDVSSLAFANEDAILAGHADPEAAYVREVLPEKIRLSCEYADRATVRHDVAVMIETVREIFPPKRIPRGRPSVPESSFPPEGREFLTTGEPRTQSHGGL